MKRDKQDKLQTHVNDVHGRENLGKETMEFRDTTAKYYQIILNYKDVSFLTIFPSRCFKIRSWSTEQDFCHNHPKKTKT